MYKITQLKQAKFDPNYVLVFLDSSFWISLSKDEVLNFNIYKGLELSSDIKVELEERYNIAKKLALITNYQKTRPHSVCEVYQYLTFRKGIEAQEAEFLTNQAEQKGILDDIAFAKWFASQKLSSGKYGKNKVKFDLLKKGVSASIIKDILINIQEAVEETENQSLRNLIEKLSKQVPETDMMKKKHKIMRRALSKGYDYKSVKDILHDIDLDDN